MSGAQNNDAPGSDAVVRFRRTAGGLVGNVMVGLGAGIVVLILGAIFGEPGVGTCVLAALAALAAGGYFLYSENILLEVEGTALRYYRAGKLRATYDLPDCACRVRCHSSRMSATNLCLLFLRDAGGKGEERRVDCSPLGLRQCWQLFTLVSTQALDFVEQIDGRTAKRYRQYEESA